MSLSHLSGMIEYLVSASATDLPFVFRDKTDIVARRGSPVNVPAPVPPPGSVRPPTPRPTSPPPRPTSPPPRPASPPPRPTSPPPRPAPPPPRPVSPPPPPTLLLPPPAPPPSCPLSPPPPPPKQPKSRKRKATDTFEAPNEREEMPQGRGKRTRKSPQEAREERAQKTADAVSKVKINKNAPKKATAKRR
ncbi:hypothetical protein B0H10DRAFT_535716 [Mycena sp. CBHHK59/15]|nr:hypothetical protein B0H10DRAFT_535716 [Mycena sp. CBHHK59/15]